MALITSSDGVNYLCNPARFNCQKGDPYRVYEQNRTNHIFEYPNSLSAKEAETVTPLPIEVLQIICKHIPQEDLLPWVLACKDLKKIAFRRLFSEHYKDITKNTPPLTVKTKNLTPLFERAMNKAAREGHLSLLWWLYTTQPMVQESLVRYGINGVRYTTPAMKVTVLYNAAFGGHVPILEWLFKGSEGFDKTYFEPRFAKFDPEWKHDLTVLAAKSGRVDVLWWLLQQGFSFGTQTYEEIEKVNSPKVIQWLEREGHFKPKVKPIPYIRGSYEKFTVSKR